MSSWRERFCSEDEGRVVFWLIEEEVFWHFEDDLESILPSREFFVGYKAILSMQQLFEGVCF